MAIQKYYSPHEVANILGVDYHTVLREIRDGKLQAVKIRRTLRVSEESLNKYLEKNRLEK